MGDEIDKRLKRLEGGTGRARKDRRIEASKLGRVTARKGQSAIGEVRAGQCEVSSLGGLQFQTKYINTHFLSEKPGPH
jgi:hypothetical protein